MCFRYRMAYEGAIGTLPDKDQWQVVEDVVDIGVPNTSRPRGRPKKRRLPNFLEKDKKVHKCSRCSLWGHHRSTCNPLHKINDDTMTQRKNPLTMETTAEDFNDGVEYEYLHVDGF
ncbi:hypothetical protein MA16_Dca018667 [Dendrobium catenatum]|uniref:Uncharacterized protein n=1 Tax=Dendrobium catenatum TaxID=906689 RepID=A0A2I0W5W3_9ASPA|nr:hypothetical protein MA16_Dca018667 [Dendrobium catenatum]